MELVLLNWPKSDSTEANFAVADDNIDDKDNDDGTEIIRRCRCFFRRCEKIWKDRSSQRNRFRQKIVEIGAGTSRFFGHSKFAAVWKGWIVSPGSDEESDLKMMKPLVWEQRTKWILFGNHNRSCLGATRSLVPEWQNLPPMQMSKFDRLIVQTNWFLKPYHTLIVLHS